MSNEITKEQAAIQNELFMLFGHRIERHVEEGVAKFILTKLAEVERERELFQKTSLHMAEQLCDIEKALKFAGVEFPAGPVQFAEGVTRLHSKIQGLEASCAVKDNALRAVWQEDEMGWLIGGGSLPECVKCGAVATLDKGGKQNMIHEYPCMQDVIDHALSPTAGQSLLERVGRYEGALREALEYIEGDIAHNTVDLSYVHGIVQTALAAPTKGGV